MSESILDDINTKAKHGFFALVSRSAIIYCFRAISILLLSRWLAPDDYAVFAVLQGLVWSVNLFLPDLSLSIPLIQQSAEPSLKQMRSLFGLVTYRGFILFSIFVVFGSFVIDHYSYQNNFYWLLLILSFVLFIESIKIPPKMLLDRKLDFSKVMKIELLEVLAMYVVQISCAYLNYGVWSFAFALLTRSLVGLVLSYYYSPVFYLPKLYFKEIRKLFNFAFLSEMKKMVIAAKTMVIPVLLANYLEQDILGVYIWSVGIVTIPGVLTDSFDRVFFPALSKMQNDQEYFKKSFAKNLNSFLILLGLMYGLIMCCASPGVQSFFPNKWDYAIVLIPLAALGAFLNKVRYLFSSVMNSSGRPGVLLKIEGIALALEIVLAIPVLSYYSIEYYLYLIIVIETLICVLTYYLNRYYIDNSVVRRFLSILTSLIFLYYIFSNYINELSYNSWLMLVLSSTLCFSIYSFIIVTLDNNAVDEYKLVYQKVFKRL